MTDKNIWTLIGRYRIHIMGVAALWVFAFHEWASLFENWGAVGTALRFFFGAGFCGVDIFLFLSGMGLIYAIEKHSLGVFYKRRFLRVWIPCILTLTIAMLVRRWDFIYYLKIASGFSFFFENMYVISWFSFAIMTLYLLFPLYHALFERCPGKTLFTLGALLIWYVASVGLNGVLRWDLYGFTNRIPIFLMGILCGWMSRQKARVFTWLHWVGAVVVLAAGFACSYLTRYQAAYILVPHSVSAVPNFLIALSAVFLLAQFFGLMEKYLPKLGKTIFRILAFYGAMSLEFYCIQDLFPNIAGSFLPETAAPLLIHGTSFVVMSTMGWAFAKLCAWIAAKLKK